MRFIRTIFKIVTVIFLAVQPCFSDVSIKVLPNEVTPKQVILENDNLYMEIQTHQRRTDSI